MKILILAAGGYVTDPTRGEYPLFLAEMRGGGLLVERLIEACKTLDPSGFVFCLRQNDAEVHHVDDILSLIVPGCALVRVHQDTMGAACTALLAVDHIEPDEELIVTTASDYVDSDLRAIVSGFRDRGADAGGIIFDALHPRYSYAKVDDDGYVIEAAEKRPISRDALAGFYWFKRASDFVTAVKEMILKDVKVHGRYFIAPALNELVLRSRKIATHRVPAMSYHPFKSQDHISEFERLDERGGCSDAKS